ncbi:hypothetical protein [Devosia sp.]|uniref:hypothetical protein n=1 Tax=Devosia sp. TaxID=1871048 RepID=UPI002AFF10EE|nr:hypothetical protein [Devosia sp.]
MRTTLLAAVAAALTWAGAAQGADIELWYGNTGATEQAILAQCQAFNASQDTHRIICIGQGTYEVAMQKAIAC